MELISMWVPRARSSDWNTNQTLTGIMSLRSRSSWHEKIVTVACCSNLKQCCEAFQTLQRSWIVAIFVGSGFLCLFTADSNMTFRMDLQSKTQQQPRKKSTPHNQLLLCVWSWRLFNWESRNYVWHFIVLRSTVYIVLATIQKNSRWYFIYHFRISHFSFLVICFGLRFVAMKHSIR